MSQSTYKDDFDRYEEYERATQRRYLTRKERRTKKPKAAKQWTQQDTLDELLRTLKLDSELTFSYTPSEHDLGWVLAALHDFYRQDLIVDVLSLVKGGKEANVYQCRAHATVATPYLAAKVYRPRTLRHLRNDAQYKQGREILTGDGAIVKANDKRTMKALQHKSHFGAFLAHQSWMQHEYQTLELLHDEKAAVPKPIAVSDNAILMQFVGSEQGAAPMLQEVRLRDLLPPAVIHNLFRKTLDTVELMLQFDRIHGDLSAYNILYWQDDIVIIDFPQVTIASRNSQARQIFSRDVQRVCDYFTAQGVSCRPQAIADAMWIANLGESIDWEDHAYQDREE